MQLTFFDKHGKPVCYTEDGSHLFSFDGTPLAYFHGNSVYTFSGLHLGWLDDGLIRDSYGRCLLFSPAAHSGPTKPTCYTEPTKSTKQTMSTKGTKQTTPARPTFGLSWSEITPEQFFRN